MTTSELGYLLLGFGIGITAGYIYVAWMMRKESINMNAQLQTVNKFLDVNLKELEGKN